jgi:hypothetical protein
MIIGLIILGAFVVQSSRSASPALDLNLFSESNFRLANSAMFVFSVTFIELFFGFVLMIGGGLSVSLLSAGIDTRPLRGAVEQRIVQRGLGMK